MKTMELPPLLCLCLLIWSGATSADQSGSKVVRVNEGTDVILPCSINVDLESKLFDWKKDGQKEVFMYDAGFHYNNGHGGQDPWFKGRVSHFEDQLKNGNASIIIRDTKVKDSGSYTCDFPRLQPTRQTFHIKLVVAGVLKDRTEENIPGAAAKPSVTIIKTDDGVLLQCEVQGASPEPKVEWKDSSGNMVPAKEPQVTERGGSYDVTLQATVTKTDTFSCVVTQEDINHQISAEIYGHIDGASLKPSVTIIKTDSEVLLQCEVQGASPEPKVEWRDSSGNMVPAKEPQVTERGGSYDVTLQATVTKTDTFSCVVTQEDINHQISAEIHVPLGSSGWIIAVASVVSTLLVGGVLLAVLVSRGCVSLKCNQDEKKKRDASGSTLIHGPPPDPDV